MSWLVIVELPITLGKGYLRIPVFSLNQFEESILFIWVLIYNVPGQISKKPGECKCFSGYDGGDSLTDC